ncbi:hypothetical protein VTO42DRAFT_5278 [Malbranchea cinnamomea]
MTMFTAVSPPTIPQTDLFSIPPFTEQSVPALSTHNVNLPPRRPSTSMSMSKETPQTPDPKRQNRQQEQPSLTARHQTALSSPLFPSSTFSTDLAAPSFFSSPRASPVPFTSSPPSRSSPPYHRPDDPHHHHAPSIYARRYLDSMHRNPAGRLARCALSRDKRREHFLSRVRRSRDEAAFDARAEQMQRLECMARRREFVEMMERSAPELEVAEEEEDEDEIRDGDGIVNVNAWTKMGREQAGMQMQWRGGDDHAMLGDGRGGGGTGAADDEAALEEFLIEEAKFQAFVEEMEQVQQMQGTEHGQNVSYDDDDYDNLFVTLLSHEGDQSQSHDMMDTSHG